MSTMAALAALRSTGMMPADGLIYLGLGFRPPKRNAIVIDIDHIPTDRECYAVAGLDVVLVYRGESVRYGLLRQLTGSLYQARPSRLMIVDLDHSRTAFLKTVGTSWKR